jgi:hypothetical protein
MLRIRDLSSSTIAMRAVAEASPMIAVGLRCQWTGMHRVAQAITALCLISAVSVLLSYTIPFPSDTGMFRSCVQTHPWDGAMIPLLRGPMSAVPNGSIAANFTLPLNTYTKLPVVLADPAHRPPNRKGGRSAVCSMADRAFMTICSALSVRIARSATSVADDYRLRQAS